MDFNIVKIEGFIVLILLYMMIRKLFSKFADFTEKIGQSNHQEEEIKQLNSKIISLEKQINNKE
ncbi:hypothetical protein SAMN05421846_10117 [Chryseobacterium taeanense]|uniref:BhlA holin family protein n=1 Tax=Chryseobacterium taeanense TaxID=311334 RepID=A0A1G8D3J2_9FLAO|nr:hypothetical protein [Chryseobacterium taeanense]SDH51740.1 hypothetical protein SAMN05421846_10117 [Chryseobacterium taeanense]